MIILCVHSIVGKPVNVTKDSSPSDEMIAKVQREYYLQIKHLFDTFQPIVASSSSAPTTSTTSNGKGTGHYTTELVFLDRKGEISFSQEKEEEKEDEVKE